MKTPALLERAGGMALIALLAWGIGDAFAHGQDHAHKQVMLDLKQQIPEDLQIMDRTPVTPTAESLERGADAYARFCAACHGPKGLGDGPAAAALATPPASFLDLKHSAVYGPGEKYWIIGQGIGAAGMPGFAGQIAPRERWDLVNFILELQKSGEPAAHGH